MWQISGIFLSNRKEDTNMSKKPVMLMILDGYGINPREEGNAVFVRNIQESFVLLQ